MSLSLIAVLLAVLPTSAFATDSLCEGQGQSRPGCEFIRLDCPGYAMEKVPVLDQGDWQICTAFVLSSLVDAYRFSNLPPKGDRNHSLHTSPVEAALGCLENNEVALQTDGEHPSAAAYLEDNIDAYRVLDRLKKAGACNQEVVPWNVEAGEVMNRELIEKLQELHFNYLRQAALRSQVRVQVASCLKRVGLVLEDQELESLLSQSDPARFLRELFASKCTAANRQKINPELKYVEEDRDLETVMQRQLHRGRQTQPLQVGLCANFFEEGLQYRDHPQYNAKQDGIEQISDACQQHSALVVGMRYRDKQCEVFIRNPWGTSCNGYEDSLTARCEPSGIWIPMDVLRANWIDIGYLKD